MSKNQPSAFNLQRSTALRAGAQLLGIALDDAQIALFERYAALIVEWNSRVNLTSITTSEGIAVRHFVDSLAVALVWQPSGPARVADIGSGAGLPGLALAILWPAIQLTVIESVGKKAAFIATAARELGLDGTVIIAERAEDAARRPDLREQFELVTARALAPLPVLAELTLPFAKIGGAVVAYKSGDIQTEIASAQRALELLGGGQPTFVDVPVPQLAGHCLVRLPKERPTQAAYPRRVGLPAKRPLK